MSDYRAYIFDLDGTLYRQFPVRMCMALWLIGYYVMRPYRFRELCVLRKYRRLREECFGVECEDFGSVQIDEAARICGVDSGTAREVVEEWMIRRPLGLVRRFRRKGLLEAMRGLQEKGKTIIVYSDYPVKEKLNAMNFTPDYGFWSGDELIRCMKPDCSGLVRVLDSLELGRECVLYVGDRDDRDGLCAKAAGVSYMDVKEFMRRLL